MSVASAIMPPVDAYVGTSGFSYPKWRGSFYPAGMKPADMLAHYAARFRSVEINNTFYRMPRDSVLERWVADTPEDFRFVLKGSRRITHQNRLRDAGGNVEYLLARARTLGPRLGPLLFQPPPTLRKDVPLLREFLALFPGGFRVAIELRHRSWFEDDVFEALHAADAALCIADRDEADGVEVPFEATASWGYVRLRRPGYDDAELENWASRVSGAWPTAYVFFMHEDEGEAPELARRLQALLAASRSTSDISPRSSREP